MLNAIVAVFVVVAVFLFIASLFTVYVWRADPYQFAMWRAALRARREGRGASAP